MKNFLDLISSTLKKSFGCSYFQKKQIFKWMALSMVFSILNLTIGCQNYFKVKTTASPTSQTISHLNEAKKTLVVHFEKKKWVLTNCKIKNDTIIGVINDYQEPPMIRQVNPNTPNRYLNRRTNNERYLLKEVHLYPNKADIIRNNVVIPVKSIPKIEIYEKDNASTIGSYFLGSVATIATAALFAVVIGAATYEAPVHTESSSCPFIYTWNGENFDFAGEIYSGSIHRPLERNDYLKLPTYPGQKTYSMKISNETREIQHTNLAELLVIDHPLNTAVLIDKYGKIATMGTAVKPSWATNLAGENILNQVAFKDSLFYQSHSTGKEAPLKDGLIMQFPNQGNAKTAKLVVHAKNSIIVDLMLGQFHDLLGSSYSSYMKRHNHAPAERMQQWSLNQGIPLSLFVERNKTWELVDYYNIAGPMKFKEDMISIPLKGNESNPLKIKLEFGNFMWEIDNAWVDYSPEIDVKINTIPVQSAITEELNDVAGLLQKDDNNYYTQPNMQNLSVANFSLPEWTDQNRTIILHSKGWYQLLRNPEGKPEREKLRALRKPGSFNRFINQSMQLKDQLVLQPN